MSTLKKLYRLFLRDKVNEQYELSYIEGAVLGENILNGYYFLVLRKIDWDSGKVYHYLLTENCKKPSLIKLKEYESILITTDGLHNLLDGKKLIKMLNEPLTTQEKVDSLVNKALDLGGNDNITLILLEK